MACEMHILSNFVDSSFQIDCYLVLRMRSGKIRFYFKHKCFQMMKNHGISTTFQ